VILGSIGADLRQAVDAKNRPRWRALRYTLGRFSSRSLPTVPRTLLDAGKLRRRKRTLGVKRPRNCRAGVRSALETFSHLQGKSGRSTYAVIDGSGPGRDLAVRQLQFATTAAIVMGLVLALGIALIALLQAANF
jgi:hypothetical protein